MKGIKMIQESMNFDANQEVENLLDQIRKDIEEANMTIIQACSTWNSGLSAFINRNGHRMDMPVAMGKADTSQAAGKKIELKVGSLRTKVYNALYDVGPMSTTQLANYIKKNYGGIQPRTSELSKAGYIEDSGKRWVNQHNNQEKVWQVCTPENKLI